MANELKQSQLARIVVPAITDAEYSTGLADAFDKINDNFKKIASLPFLQGVQGDSYQLEEYPIWEKDTTENWILTEDGKILLDSIFGIDTTRDGNSFNNIRECIGQLMPEENGVSPIDFFKNGNDIVNNSLYFYVIKDDTGNIIEKQLGQYYYFVDGRLKEVGSIYNSENAGSVLSDFNDYTGFYQYRYNPKSYNQKYLKVEILPSIYYDQNKNDICWKFNGNETGISAIGVKGADGKDAELSIVKVDLNNENGLYSNNSTSGKVVGILNTSANNGETTQWITDTKYFKTGKALIYMSGKIPVENTEESTVNPLSGETEVNEVTINDFAYGEIIKQNDEYIAYWEPNCVFSKILTNNAFTQYFYNMGTVSYTNNAPFFLAIPSIQNRDSSTEEAKQHAHIIKGYEGDKDNNIESLNIFHSDIAFDEVGNQQMNATESSNKLLNIKNYDVNILKTLTTKGKITGESGLEVVGPAEFGGSLTVNGALEVTEASEFSNALTVSGALTVDKKITGNDRLEIKKGATITGGSFIVDADVYNFSIETSGYGISCDDLGSMNINTNELTIDGNVDMSNYLRVAGGLGVEGDVEFSNDLTVGGTTTLNGTTVINDKLNIITNFSEESILTVGGATIQGNVHIKQNNPGTSTGALTVDKKITGNGGLEITKNGAIIYDGLYARTKKPTSVIYNGSANGLSNVLIGHNDPGNATFDDFPKDLDKGGYPLVVKSLQSDGINENGGAMVFGIGDIYALSGNNTTGYSAGTLCLNHRNRYRGDVQIGKNLNVGDNETGGNVTIYSTDNSNGRLIVKGTTGSTNTTTGALVVTGGAGIGGAVNIGGKITGSSGIKVYGGVSEFYSGTGATTDANYLKVGSTGVIVGGNIYMEDGGELTAYLDNVDINEFLNVGSKLVVNKDGLKGGYAASEIYGFYANKINGGTSDGGTGLVVYGGSGKETNENNHGKGGVGLIVRGGTAGNFTGSSASLAGYGGTGLVVYGGQAGSGPGTSNTGHTGAAIKTYGDVVIGDRTGSYLTTLSANSTGLKIDDNINIPGMGNTIYQTTEVAGTSSTNSITLDSGSRVYIYDKVHTGDSNLTITLNKAKNNIDFPIYLLFKGGIKTNKAGAGNKAISIIVGSKTFNTGNIYNNEGYTSGLLFIIFDKFCFVQCNYSPVNDSDYTNGGQRVLY